MAIEVRNVSKRFGQHLALAGVDLDIADGALCALLGPSGSGKSTLLRVIAGLERPDTGRVSISGTDVTGATPQSRGVGFVFQHYAAFKHMTVFENVAFGLKIRKVPKKEIKRQVDELLHLVQIDGFAKRYPSQLSGGQRQRMALARALAIRPKVLLLDEPFGALDAKVRRELRRWLRRLHDDMGVTTVIVTHDQEEAMEIADDVVIVNDGRIEQHGPPREVYDMPASEWVMEFLGPVNQVGEELIRPHDLKIDSEPIENGVEAVIERIVHLGFEVRVEILRADGWHMWAQMTSDDIEAKQLHEGQLVYVRSKRARSFPREDGEPVLHTV